MGIRIGIVGAGTTVAIADRHVEGFLARRGAVPSPPCAAAPWRAAGGCASGTGLTGYG